jgi:hypothetical protein
MNLLKVLELSVIDWRTESIQRECNHAWEFNDETEMICVLCGLGYNTHLVWMVLDLSDKGIIG